LEEDGLIEGEAGSRKKTEYRLTDKGTNALRQSLTAGKRTLWEANRHQSRTSMEALPRILFLLWIYFGSGAVDEAAELARSRIARRLDRAKSKNQDLSAEIDGLLSGQFPFGTISDKPAAIGKSYLLLKAKTELALLEYQSHAIAAMIAALPAELEGIGKDFVADFKPEPRRATKPREKE
jgi:DNA-binding PadR family transcriptional regulator